MIKFKAQQVHAVVLCFMMFAAGCRGVGDFSVQRLEGQVAALPQLEHSQEADLALYCDSDEPGCDGL